MTAVAALIVTAHVAVPLHAPPQPVNVKPAAGVSASVTSAPCAKDAEQVDGQLIPTGLLLTVPEPVTVTVNCWGVAA